MRSRPAVLTGLVACALGLVTGCGAGHGLAPDHRAAEPSVSQPLTVKPAGTVTTVGDRPQGIAYDARTRSVVVAVHDPDRLLVLDAATLRLRRSVPLPGKVRHLQVVPGGGTVLAPVETANALLEVNLRTGAVRRTAVQRHPHDAAGAADGDVLVGNEFSGSVSVVRRGRVVHTFDDLRQPGGVLVEGSTGVAVDVADYTVTTYDLDTMKREARIDAGSGPTHAALGGGGKLAVVDTRGGQVLLDTIDPLRQIGRLSLPGSPYGIAGDPETGTVWVTQTWRNRLVGLDVTGHKPRVVATYPTVEQPDTVAVAPGSHTLWVTGTKDGVVQRITR